MRYLRFITIIIVFFAYSCANPNKSSNTDVQSSLTAYDSVLAKECGADNYGMKKYVMAFLKAGPNKSKDSASRAKLQQAHLENIVRLAEEGKLVLAGPFLDGGELRGVYIFDVQSIEEAEELTKSDPAITKGTLIMELHPWYGSAALKKTNELHKKIAKINI